MSPQRPRRLHLNLALCLAAMTALGGIVLAWLGLSPQTAVLAAFALACPVTMLYAWWLSKQTLQQLDRAGPGAARRKP